MHRPFCLLLVTLLTATLSAQEVYDCKSKPKPTTSENGIYSKVHFTLMIKKLSSTSYKIAVEVKVNGEIENLSHSGYAEIFIVQQGNELSSRNWKDWDEKEFYIPELRQGIYSGGFDNLQLSPSDTIIAKIALEGKKGTYQASFDLGFLKNCKGVLE